MTRIFLTLAVLSTIVLGVAFALGMNIGDPRLPDAAIARHFLTALAALIFASLVHALVLTYFMGTGRWMEDTSRVYQLDARWQSESQSLKSRTIPKMIVCLLLLVLTGAFGAASDPASAVGFRGWGDVSGAKVHLLIAAATFAINVLVNLHEFQAIQRNSKLIEEVLGEVRRIRIEKGLPV